MKIMPHLPGLFKGLSTLLILFTYGCSAPDHDYLAYAGTYTGKGSDGIYVYRFNSTNGDLIPIGLAAKTDNPSFIVIDPRGQFLYAVNETDQFLDESTGSISAFAINKESGSLNLLQQISSLGAAPAHLSLDQSGKYLMVANYTGGNAAVFPLYVDGKLGPQTAFIQSTGSSVNTDRQAGPHAHAIQTTPDNRFILLADLGVDKLVIHRFNANAGTLEAIDSGFVRLSPGSGPRHMTFSSSGRFVYVLNELTSTVAVFELDSITGNMELRQTLSTLPANFSGTNTAAEILTDSSGRFLYVSNRGDDSIELFRLDSLNGNLTAIERVSSGGTSPRHLEIDPTGQWLFATNQGSNSIARFRVDPASGRLTPHGKSTTLASPVCIRFGSVK